jgi:hypothetical protein
VGSIPRLEFTVSDSEGRPILDCVGRCRLLLLPGKYRIAVRETEDTLPGSRTIEVTGPATVRVDPDSASQRTAGLAMGIAGPILLVVGMAVVLGESCGHSCTEEDHENGDGAALGGLALLGGLTLTPIGWVMFGKSFKPTVEVETGAPRAASKKPSGRSATLGLRFEF